MTKLAEPVKSFLFYYHFFRFVIDLTSIYEVTQQGSSNISMKLYMPVLSGYSLDIVKISSKSVIWLPPEILHIFLWGVFILPPWFFTWGENLVPVSVN